MSLFYIFEQHMPLEKLDKKHFAKGTRGSGQNGAVVAGQDFDSLKDIAVMEAKMKKICDLLSEVSCLLSLPELSWT